MLTADIDVDRSIVTFRSEDDKTELTVSTAPLATVEATPAAHLIPSPGVSAETALKQTAEIITSLTDSDGYIHIDFSDVISICASAAIRIIRFNAGDDPSKAFSDVLAAQGIDPSYCDGALINIGAPANIGLAEATSLVTIVQEAIQDDALIIWGLSLDSQQKDTEITVILAEPEKELPVHDAFITQQHYDRKDAQMMQGETMDIPNTPIRFLDLIGLDNEQLKDFTIRLNGNKPAWFDVLDAYYSSHDALMEWMFIKQWPGEKVKGSFKQKKVLQFIQLHQEDPTKWLFIGAFEVLGEYQKEDGTVAYDYREIPQYAPLDARAVVYYKKRQGPTQLMNDMGNDELRNRFSETMTLDHLSQSPISSLPFPGFENVRLTHRQLVAAVGNDTWKTSLGSVQAVYLQTDRRTGWHYVGSAYSHKGAEQGLLSRWSEYAYGDHSGGNKRLKELGVKYIEDNFQYSILEIFDMRALPKDIINREHWWMDTLGSVYHSEDEHPHGYNSVTERNSDNPVE